MKKFYYPYELVSPFLPRKGALLKIVHDDDTIGYADCHPWTEWGDLPLQHQLDQLKNNKMTPLLIRSLHFAQLDATARAMNVSLFKDLQIPKSHYLVRNVEQVHEGELADAIQKGFSTFKIKMGNNTFESEIESLKKVLAWLSVVDYRLRLDFGGKLTKKRFLGILPHLDFLMKKLDFIEDPFPFDADVWDEIQKEYKIKLAADHLSHQAIDHPESAAFLVIKPAIQDEAIFLSELESNQKLVITSYLDHPLGQVSAAYVACLCYKKAPKRVATCGLTSHQSYLPNPFSKQLSIKNGHLVPPSGTGLGFNDLLENLDWNSL